MEEFEANSLIFHNMTPFKGDLDGNKCYGNVVQELCHSQ